MLKFLYIKNYALIESLELSFESGLNVITGETGAGKSIIIGALGLLLGNRTDTTVLNKKSGKCIVEGTFSMDNKSLKPFLQSKELDVDDVLRIRREINTSAKSRAFINDTPVSLVELKELSQLIIDVNAQNQMFLFKSSDRQLEILDDLANTKKLLSEYRLSYDSYRKNEKELAELKERESQATLQQDFLQFQYDELSAANIESGEEKAVKAKLDWMDNAESIKQALFFAVQNLTQSDDNILNRTEIVYRQLLGIQNIQPGLNLLQQRLESSIIELKDIAAEYEQLFEESDFDTSEHANVQDRFDVLSLLMQKHKKNSSDELIEYCNEIDAELQDYNSLSDKIQKAQKQLQEELKELLDLASEISQKRKKSIAKIEKQIEKGLSSLGMKDSIFNISIETLNEPISSGIDKVNFLFSSNKGRHVELISKIASGGELSRLVLTLKSLLSSSKDLPTVIFDEIDTGVSGDIASKVGDVMKNMAKNMQVIAITHLPQIAAKGESHYKVFKKDVNGVIQSDIKMLDDAERLNELAMMLSGDSNSEIALKMAKELIL